MPVLQRFVLQRPLLRTTACTGGPVERSPAKHIGVLRFVKHGKGLRKELTDAQLTSFSCLPVPPFLFWSKTWTGARCMRAATGPLISSGTTRAPTITLGGNKGDQSNCESIVQGKLPGKKCEIHVSLKCSSIFCGDGMGERGGNSSNNKKEKT